MIRTVACYSYGEHVEVRALAFDSSRMVTGDNNNDIWVRTPCG